ncbi:MAG: FAD-dependent oxidoreductase [Nitrososphaerales archaeon]|nr:FAD-dependent oxidoreductase [Nitrososphaerales archaeon]
MSIRLAIIGAGILGTSFAYWASRICNASILVFEKEVDVGLHATLRNTGVMHRPFYLNPAKKKIFAQSSQLSYEKFWLDYAKEKNLPWAQIGTYKIALNEEDVKELYKYMKWGLENGMDESELEFLDGKEVKKFEPHVECVAAVLCKTDTAVDFKKFAEALRYDAEAFGVKFLTNHQVLRIEVQNGKLNIFVKDREEPFQVDYVINSSGGSSLKIAQSMDLGLEYTDLHFRGEYWVVEPKFGELIHRNIYTVPYVKEYPFLDPHFIVRYNGVREIGPNAVLVASSETYNGLANNPLELLYEIFEKPITNKLRLFVDKEFITLVSREWRSSLFKREMCNRVRRFVPELKNEYLIRKGLAGVRNSVIDKKGFVPEAIELRNDYSCHIVNFNSPGATGAPAYSAYILNKLIKDGFLPLKAQKSYEMDKFKEIVDEFD